MKMMLMRLSLCVIAMTKSIKFEDDEFFFFFFLILCRGINNSPLNFKTSLPSDPQVATLGNVLAFVLKILISLQPCVSFCATPRSSH